MSGSLIAGCIWVVLATITAFLPMRYQFPPGIALLIAAPVLLGWIAVDTSIWVALIGAFAFLSMFRRPLVYLSKKAMGRV